MATRKLTVVIVGDADALERSFKRAGRATKGFDGDIRKAARGALAASLSFKGLGRSVAFASGAFLGGAGFVAILKSSVSAASNLAEQVSKTDQVFEKSSASVKAWANTTSSSMGLASDRALEAVSTFGLLFRNVGQGEQPAADLSKTLVKLGADLASFSNTTVDDALRAIRSGLTGEIEPLRRYGVFLSEARTKTQALADTGKTSAAQLTTGEKVLARYKILLKDTTRAQGDFERTSGGLANQQRILGANLRQTQIILGQALIPKVLEITSALNDWLGDTKNQERLQRDLNIAVEAGVTVVDKFSASVRLTADAFAIANGGDRQEWTRWIKDVGGVVGDLSDSLAPGVADNIKTLSGALNKPPDDGWATLFKGLADLARVGRIAALDQLEALRGQRNLDRQVGPGIPGKVKGGGFGIGGAAPTAAQLRAIELAKVAGTGTQAEVAAIKAILDADNAAIAFAEKQIDAGRGNARQFADELKDLYIDRGQQIAELAQIAKDRADKTKAAAEKVKAAETKRRKAIGDMVNAALGTTKLGVGGDPLSLAQVRKALAGREQAAQFRALGLTGAGDEFAPTRKALQALATKTQEGLRGTILDTDPNRNLFKGIRKVLSGQLGALTRETRLKVKELLDALKPAGDVLDPNAFRKTSGASFRRSLGLNLTGLAARRFDVAFATVGQGGRVPAGRSQAFRGVQINGGLHLHGVQDVKQLEGELTRRAVSRPAVRRGAR